MSSLSHAHNPRWLRESGTNHMVGVRVLETSCWRCQPLCNPTQQRPHVLPQAGAGKAAPIPPNGATLAQSLGLALCSGCQ